MKNKLPYDEVITSDGKEILYRVVVEKLVYCFNEWQKQHGERPLRTKAFGKRFRKIVPEMRPAHDVKIAPVGIKRQFNCFEIKSLKECRDHFVARQGLKYKTWNQADKFDMLDVDKGVW